MLSGLPRRRVLVCALLATLAAAGLALAKDKKDAPRIKGPLVEVALTEYAIAMPPALKHGWVTLHIVNNGTVPHGLTAEDARKTQVLAPQVPPGGAVFVPIKLRKGTFLVYCSQRQHADAGMQAVAYVH